MRSNVVTFKTLDGATAYNSVEDWGFLLTHCDEQKPAPKFERIEVPGANGSVDVSTALSGDIPFADREVNLTFNRLCASHDEAYALANEVASAIHGKQMKVQTPDALADGGTWYEGDVEVTQCTFADCNCEIEVHAVCDPYRYAESGGYAEAPTAEVLETQTDVILSVPQAARELAREVYSSFKTSAASANAARFSAGGIALCFSRSPNLFDMNAASMQGKTESLSASKWLDSNQIHQDGQRAVFGAVSVNWVERVTLNATPASYIGLGTGETPVFPFAQDTRCRIWLYSGAVSEVAAGDYVSPSDNSYRVGATVKATYGGAGSQTAGGLWGGTTYTGGTFDAPAVGGQWNGEYVDFAIRPNTIQIYIDVAGITAPDVYALVAFYKAGEAAPASWVAPDMLIGELQFPEPMETVNDGGDWSAAGFDNSVAQAFYLTNGVTRELAKIPDMTDAAYISACAVDSSGQLVYTRVPFETYIRYMQMVEFTIDAGAEPAYPTATTSPRAGAVVEYNGSAYLLPAGTETLLDTLLNRGENTLRVSAIGSVPSVTFSWPMGVL